MDLLTIDALEQDLRAAEAELAKATAERLRAYEVENQWKTEVNSLRSLIQVRKQRLNPVLGLDQQPIPQALSPLPGKEEKPISKVQWIGDLIKASGDKGISPPEILQAAAERGIKMHPNYPYVVLKKLEALEAFTKQDGRYYALENLK